MDSNRAMHGDKLRFVRLDITSLTAIPTMSCSAQEKVACTPRDKVIRGSATVRADRLAFAGFVIGLAVLFFSAGAAAHEFRWNLYKNLLAPPFASLRAWMHRIDSTSSILESDLW